MQCRRSVLLRKANPPRSAPLERRAIASRSLWRRQFRGEPFTPPHWGVMKGVKTHTPPLTSRTPPTWHLQRGGGGGSRAISGLHGLTPPSEAPPLRRPLPVLHGLTQLRGSTPAPTALGMSPPMKCRMARCEPWMGKRRQWMGKRRLVAIGRVTCALAQ